MRSSESFFILASTVVSQEHESESYESLTLLNRVKLQLEGQFRDVPFGLSLLFPHRPSDNTARTKILDRTPYRNCQQLDRLCNWIANVTAWLYSGKPVLHLRIRVQHAVVA
jgi:hypothetical protein